MIIVDLQDLEERARMALESIGGVVLEPEALLLIVSEIRRLKVLLGEQHNNLLDMRNGLLELRTALAGSLTLNCAAKPPITPVRKTKLKMQVIAKDAKEHGDGATG